MAAKPRTSARDNRYSGARIVLGAAAAGIWTLLAVSGVWDMPPLAVATGGFGAVCLAIYVPTRQQRLARESQVAEKRVKQSTLAAGIHAEVVRLRARIMEVTDLFEKVDAGTLEPTWDTFLGKIEITVPPALENRLRSLHQLGEPAATDVLELVKAVSRYAQAGPGESLMSDAERQAFRQHLRVSTGLALIAVESVRLARKRQD